MSSISRVSRVYILNKQRAFFTASCETVAESLNISLIMMVASSSRHSVTLNLTAVSFKLGCCSILTESEPFLTCRVKSPPKLLERIFKVASPVFVIFLSFIVAVTFLVLPSFAKPFLGLLISVLPS